MRVDIPNRRSGAPNPSSTRFAREAAVSSLLLAACILVPALSNNSYWARVWLIVGIYALASIGLSILKDSGQMSFGQGAVFGVGAYSTALCMTDGHLPFAVSALIGVAAAVVFGAILALPSFRVQGFYLAFVTLAASLVFPDLLFGFDSTTHAVSGVVAPVPALSKPVAGQLSVLTLLVILAVAAALFAHLALRRSRLGWQMRAVATSPESAQTLGVRVGVIRVLSFVIAAALAGVAGILYVPYSGYVGPGAFPLQLSMLLYFGHVVGGNHTIAGPVLGVTVLYLVPDVLLSQFVDYRLIIYGIITFALLAVLPDGLLPSAYRWLRRWRPRREQGGDVISAVAAEVAGTGTVPAPREPDEPKELEPALDVDGVTKRFGAVVALNDVRIRVARGQVHALIGPNGCGKSTLLNVICGLIRCDAGSVRVGDRDVTRRAPVAISRLGVGRTFQTPRIDGQLSAWQNIAIKVAAGTTGSHLDTALQRNRRALDGVMAESLPHAARRILETLRAGAGETTLLLLDEPAGGLSVAERETFGRFIRTLVRTTGVTVVLVEHDLGLVWDMADTVTVMSEGKVLDTGPVASMRSSASLDVLVGRPA